MTKVFCCACLSEEIGYLHKLIEWQEKLCAAYRVGNTQSADRCIDNINRIKGALGLR